MEKPIPSPPETTRTSTGEVYYHQAFGLSFCSPFPLPELESGGRGRDVAIRIGRIDVPTPHPEGECLFAGGEEACFGWESAGRFLVTSGREITIDPVADVESENLRRFLLGPVLAMLLHQRGFLVLHGSAVAVEDEAIAVIGDSGKGKSTTVAAMVQNGHMLLGDDIVAIDLRSKPSVVPGFPEINLWNDSAGAIDGVAALPVLRTEGGGEKRAYRIEAACAGSPIPLRHMYKLETGGAPATASVPVRESVRVLFDHSFGPALLPFGMGAPLLQRCAELARQTPFSTLTRGKSLADLPELVRLLEEENQ